VKLKELIYRGLLLPLYLISYVFPRRKNLWIFGSYASSFVDNSKYLFIYVSEHQKDVEAIWISPSMSTVLEIRQLGFRAYKKWSFLGVFYSLRGYFYFYSAYVSDINLWTSAGGVKINLWHGVPLKKIEFDIKSGPLGKIFKGGIFNSIKYPNHYVKAKYVLSPSEEVSKYFSTAFRTRMQDCLNFGYPRNDIILSEEHYIEEFIRKYESQELWSFLNSLSGYRSVFVYMPTWRDTGSDFVSESGMDFSQLNDVMKSTNSVFLMKLHSNSSINFDGEGFSNVKIIENTTDMYTIIPFCSHVITDYSSIMFDAYMAGKQLIFFPFDKEEYVSARELYFNYDEVLSSMRVCFDFTSLLRELESPCGDNSIKSKFFLELLGESDNKSSERLVKYLKTYAGMNK
jgi:CDP-glycerol glycerophosphotransferase (TagB/SpsB family)